MIRLTRLILIPVLFVFCAWGATAQSTRLTAIISDTHFGVGKTPDGKWHPYEDARWAPEFRLFLEELNRQGNGNTDLVFNGDTFELWQSLANDCTYPDENLSCTEQEALNRLRIVIAAHQAELDAIRSFASNGANTVFILPGNHDAALRFPQVAAEVLRAIGASPDRVRIPRDGYWLSADGMIYAEHGHQIGYDTNHFSTWPAPFIQKNGVTYLQRPWGEQFVQRFYNYYENKYPIIDNLMEEIMGVKYGMAAEGAIGLHNAFGRFAMFYLAQSSWTQIGQSLGGRDGVRWDTATIRKRGNHFFAESIPNDDPLRPLVVKSIATRTFGIKLSDLKEEELQGICDVRAAIVAEDTRNHKPLRVTLCPKANLGAAVGNLITSRDSIFQQYLSDTLTRLRTRGNARPFSLFVFAHTHLPEASYSPFERSSSNWRPIVINSGAWQRTLSEQQLESYRSSRRLRARDVLRLQPEDLPPCYAVVTIPPYGTSPRSLLRYWKKVGNDWLFANTCD
jgi:hypothetical protein